MFSFIDFCFLHLFVWRFSSLKLINFRHGQARQWSNLPIRLDQGAGAVEVIKGRSTIAQSRKKEENYPSDQYQIYQSKSRADSTIRLVQKLEVNEHAEQDFKKELIKEAKA